MRTGNFPRSSSAAAGHVRPWAALALTLLLGACSAPSRPLAVAGTKDAPAASPVLGTDVLACPTPDVWLVDQHGRRQHLPELLGGPRPVVLNFVFTTCTTICPVMTATFSQVSRAMEGDLAQARLVSISLDPEYDTPEVLEAYAERYGAGESWLLLTGDARDVLAVLRAFDALSGSKMNHRPYTYARPAGASEWTRIEGLLSASDLAAELDRILGTR